jgi:1-acyl-sn-glycerol-3-phosphate acyltransferase
MEVTTDTARTDSARTDPALGHRAMVRFARFLVRIFFRRIDVAGASRLPVDDPVVLVANHVNGLVDGLVLMAVLPRYPRFLGKSTLFKILPLRPFLRLAGVVPVHRTKDEPTPTARGTARNEAAFSTSRALLASDGLVAVFPEGISHDEARLQPLRTGAARIALGAAVDGGATDLVTVAAGLVYDDKARFRSEALVRIGEPVPVAPWAGRYREDPMAAVRELTASLADQLGAVVPMYESRQDELAFRRIASIVCGPEGDGEATGASLAARDDLTRALGAAADQGPVETARVAQLRALTDRYEAELSLLGLNDAEVAEGLTPARYRSRLSRSLAVAVLTAPVAALGALIHAVPYQIVKVAGRRPTNEGMRATVKLAGCITLFTATYTAIGVRVGRRRGAVAGLMAFLLGPLSGYVTVRWAERAQRLGGRARARATLRNRRDLRQDLAARRAEIVTTGSALLHPATARPLQPPPATPHPTSAPTPAG